MPGEIAEAMTHPTSDADGWIAWTPTEGAVCPVANGTRVQIRLRPGRPGIDDESPTSDPEMWDWRAIPNAKSAEIIAYRILSPADPPAAPVADPAAEIAALKAEAADWRERVGKLHENIEAWTEDAANHLARAMKAEADVARLREALGKAATDLEAIGGCPQTDVGLVRVGARIAARVARSALQPKDADHG